MDGPQDLGGKESFGPIEVDSPLFRDDWEKRQWALSQLAPIEGVTIDWFRHSIECMDPKVYLGIPYFEKWCLNALSMGIDTGLFSMTEVLSGHANQPAPPAAVEDVDALARQLRAKNHSFSGSVERPALFAVGDTVMTQPRPSPGHTRLPAYARAAKGTVTAHHGGHLYPDAGAEGLHVYHHLYTVEFAASALWNDAEDPNDMICLDLWEPYLEAG